MASERQIAANRANAKKSTGPRTPEGKARSSLNALVHGLTARRVVLPGEDARHFAAFARAIRADMRPRGPAQALMAGRVIEAAWKLRRAGAAQEAFVASALEHYRQGGLGRGARAVDSAAALLARAVGGDAQAEPFLHLDDHAARCQREMFTALRQLARQKSLEALEARLASEAKNDPRCGGGRSGATVGVDTRYVQARAPGPNASHN
jgi:hypothetical protein